MSQDKIDFLWLWKVFALVVWATVQTAATADTVTWAGTGDGVTLYWDDASKWTCSDGETHRVPMAGDDVVIPLRSGYPYKDHKIVATNVLPVFKSVYIGGKRTVVLNGWENKISCEELVLEGSSTAPSWGRAAIQCGDGFVESEMSNRVWIVADRLIMTNAYTEISAVGYKFANGRCWQGVEIPYPSKYSAAHGGKASSGPGLEYGSLTAPEEPGSGASYFVTNSTGVVTSFGPSGGGAIRINAKHMLVKGRILADGKSNVYEQGRGSGGSVYITCETIDGDGVISANGGGNTILSQPSKGSAAGGGRVSVNYNSILQESCDCRISFSARGGLDLNGSTNRYEAVGFSGTLYFTDDRFLRRPGRMLAGKVYYGPNAVMDNAIVGENVSYTNTLFALEDGGSVNVTGDLTFTGDSTRANGLEILGRDCPVSVGGDLVLNSSRIAFFNGGTLSVGGDFNCGGGTNGMSSAEVYLQATPTNGVDKSEGATISVGGVWRMGESSAYYPRCDATNGSIVVATVGSLLMATNCLVDANGAGWARNCGPGQGKNSSSHGGLGGSPDGKNNGIVYGDPKAPVEPGSGTVSSTIYGQSGGGVIRIHANNRMQIGGSFLADGIASSITQYGVGGTAGGSIYLSCGGRIDGIATLTADGGKAVNSGYGGGGGRIALVGRGSVVTNQMVLSVAGGNYTSKATGTETERTIHWGEDGTIFIKGSNGLVVVFR